MTDTVLPIELAIYQNDTMWHRKMRQYLINRLRITKSELRQIGTLHPKEWISAFRFNSIHPLFVKGDIDGFVTLFFNNLATLLAVILSLQPILGNEIVYGKIAPG
jgi:hypothetical protein